MDIIEKEECIIYLWHPFQIFAITRSRIMNRICESHCICFINEVWIFWCLMLLERIINILNFVTTNKICTNRKKLKTTFYTWFYTRFYRLGFSVLGFTLLGFTLGFSLLDSTVSSVVLYLKWCLFFVRFNILNLPVNFAVPLK